MKKNIFIISLVVITLAFNIMAQEKKEDKKTLPKAEESKVFKADSADVSSIDAIIKATYDVISGTAEEKRDWNRFRSLFHKDARLIPSGTNPNTGITTATAFTPEDYIKRSEPFMMKNGFFEKEIARRVELFGNIAHVFSTYEGKYKADDEKPFLRGINSFQLLNDGKRWWVVTIYWQAENPSNLLPEKYLKNN
jgi:hypothetical protein